MSNNVNSTKKPVFKHLKITDLAVDPQLNIRFRAGTESYGVKITRDTYDLSTLETQIIDAGQIFEPIVVSKQKDNSYKVLRGNRRTLAGQNVYNAGTTTVNLKNALDKVPCQVYSDLTPAEEKEMVLDQNSKPFLRSELIKFVWSMQAEGKSFPMIAAMTYETFGRLNGKSGADKLTEMAAIPPADHEKRRSVLLSWLRGSLDMTIMAAYNLGVRVQKAMLLSEMKRDGLVNETDEQPEFDAAKNGQARMTALRKAKELDSDWNAHTGGANFNAKIEEFIKEDKTGTKAVVVKALSKSENESFAKASKSSLGRACFTRAAGTENAEFLRLDEKFAIIEAKEKILYDKYKDNLKPEILAVLSEVFMQDNILAWEKYLAANCK